MGCKLKVGQFCNADDAKPLEYVNVDCTKTRCSNWVANLILDPETQIEQKPIKCPNCEETSPGSLIQVDWEDDCVLCGKKIRFNPETNNGGSTGYYKFKPSWTDCQDIIEDREMNFSQGNLFKAAFCFNIKRHDSTDYERELNKIIWFANRELDRIKS